MTDGAEGPGATREVGTAPVEPAIRPLAESGLLVELGGGIDPALVARVAALTAAIDAAAIAGLVEVIPSYRTVLLAFDPAVTDGEAIAAAVRRLVGEAGGVADPPGREVGIAVAYGGEGGPDLADVAAHVGLPEEEVARRHAAGEYRVACMGFAPGFAFLVGLPPELEVPRRATPRVRVPAGSVGIGGAQTGVYPLPTPGGWNLIGRTEARLFDLGRAEPFLLRPGDRVRFRAVAEGGGGGGRGEGGEEGEGARVAPRAPDRPAGARPTERPLRQGAGDEPVSGTRAAGGGAITEGHGSRCVGVDSGGGLLVLEPGLLTTVQDLGRPGLMRFGVAPGGALDRAALVLGNRLLGNPAGAAALELTLVGPRLRFGAAAVVALTGADLGARLGGGACPRWEPMAVAAGEELAFEPGAAGPGVRAYLCLAGGVAVGPTMGSRSTDLFAGFGGWQGRALRAGDELPLGEPALAREEILRRRLGGPPPAPDPGAPVRVVLGPQAGRFTAEGIAAFLGEGYAVTSKADRTGLRLAGPAVALAAGADLVSEGIGHGAIQVPGDEQPIVLLAARQTIGGYPKIGTVIGADLDGLGQRRPGNALRFEAVGVAAARELTLAALAELERPVVEAPRAVPGWSATGSTVPPPDRGEAGAGGWTLAGVARLAEGLAAALREGELSSLQVEIGAIGFSLALGREATGAAGEIMSVGRGLAGPPGPGGGGERGDRPAEFL